MSIKGIFDGYTNAVTRSDENVERLAHQRQRLCNVCPHLRTELGIRRCGVCGCPLAALTRQNEKICHIWKRNGL